MKKKILFMVVNMNVGGTEKALLNMIDVMPEDKYDITILMLEKYGGFLNAIPKRVNVEYLDGYREMKPILNNPPKTLVLNHLKNWEIIKAIYLMFIFFITAISKERTLLFNSILHGKEIPQNKYDAAIAYAGPMDFISYFIAYKIKANTKIQWIHFDVTKIGFNRSYAARIYKNFDRIFVVSEEGQKKLISMFPGLKYKIQTFKNILSPELIIKMADERGGFEDSYNGVRILTVGRLSKEKGQDLTIKVLAKLKSEGYKVRWYCIGDGIAKNEYETLIKEYGIERDFILLGSTSNPYPFMKQCDIYVQPSRHEGYCITLSEAKCFDIPIICTNFTGAREQIEPYETGLIVEFNEEQMFTALKMLINDKKITGKIKKNIQNTKIDTTKEIEKLTLIVK